MAKTIVHNKDKSCFILKTESRLNKVLNDIFTKSSFQINKKQIFVNVIFVDLAPDAKSAKVVMDAYGLDEKQKEDLVDNLNRSFVRQVRGLLSQKMQMKYTPDIKFFLDKTSEREAKINKILTEEGKFFE